MTDEDYETGAVIPSGDENGEYWGEQRSLTPSIHYQTTNVSAIKVHKLLRDLGVKNNKFMLTLYDTGLAHINPFSKNLSEEWKRRIHAEVCRNFWYYLREIVRINVPGGTTKFLFHRGNVAVEWLLLNNVNTYLELPRQNQKTGSVAAFMSWIYGFKTINSKSSMMSKDPESVKDNLNSIRKILENLPPYLQVLDPKKDHLNKESFQSSSSGNVIQTRSPPGNEDGAMNKGRGSSEPVQWNDEMPFINFIKTITLNSAPSWKTAADFAKANGSPYVRIFSSTPGILGTPEGDFVFNEFLPQCVRFDERLFYDQPSVESLKAFIHDESRNDFVYVKFTYKQLGKGEDYFQEQCRALMNDMDAIQREVLLKWSMRSVDSPFTKEQLDRAMKSVKTPIGSIIVQNRYVLKFFKKPDFSKRYVISVDCSGMLDTDYSSLTVTDPQTFEPIATLRSNARDSYSNTSTFGKAIADIALNIFKNALIVIEKNNMGIAIIDNILEYYPQLTDRLYSSRLEPNTEGMNNEFTVADTNGDANVNRYSDKVIVYGFDTNNARRSQMFSEILGIIINELYDCINDNDIFIELNGIVRRKGRLDHRNGKHDDMLFSWLIGLWVLCYSKILTTKYDYPIGYVRPMSILDTPQRQLKESDFDQPHGIEKMSDMVIAEFQRKNQFKIAGQTSYSDIGSGKPLTADTMNSREQSTFNMNTASISDIGDMIFGQSGSLLQSDQSFMDDEPVIDTSSEIVDNYQKAKGMNKAEREEFQRQQASILDSQILHAKNTRSRNLEKARNVKERNQLAEIIKEHPTYLADQQMGMNINVDRLVDSFFN